MSETLFGNVSICEECYEEMNFTLRKIKIDGITGYAMYEYNEKIKSMIYLCKGCGDIEMAPVFLERVKAFIQITYKGYVLVPAPSWVEDDELRGFNHVKEMFKEVGLPIIPAIWKTINFKQSSLSGKERSQISKKFDLNKNCNINHKKVLIVDDIFTSGSTVKAIIELIKKTKVKKISFLVVAAVCRKM